MPLKTLEILRKSLEIQKSLTNLSGNPEILVKIFGFLEILEISYTILSSEMPLEPALNKFTKFRANATAGSVFRSVTNQTKDMITFSDSYDQTMGSKFNERL